MQQTADHTKEWWEGDGRGEHLIDLALPHEDHEEVLDPDFVPGLSAGIATAVCVLVALGAIVSMFVAYIIDVF